MEYVSQILKDKLNDIEYSTELQNILNFGEVIQ